jgi:putative acetyltransferase
MGVTVRPVPADMDIRPERAADAAAVSELHTAAFGDDGLVSRLVDTLRGAPAALAPLSFVGCAGETVAGHVLLSASRLDAPARLVGRRPGLSCSVAADPAAGLPV